MTLPKVKCILTDRDFAIIKFLFRFKVATTSSIHKKFFPELVMHTSYIRLRTLEKSGYLQRATDNRGRHFVWSLARGGFQTLKELWPMLKEQGFSSENIIHDILVTAAHLGEFLSKTPDHVDLFTEQELRRYDKTFYPEWVPASYRHRPDGYWRVEKSTIALEVELSAKEKSKYRNVADFYRDYPSVANVVWIVGSANLIRYIDKAIKEALIDNPTVHSFMHLNDFLKDKWQAVFVAGPLKGHSISTILKHTAINQDQKFSPGLILDTRKAPMKSPTSPAPNIKSFIY